MKKIKEVIKKIKNNKEINKLYKEESKFEKEQQKQNKTYSSRTLLNKKNKDDTFLEIFIDTSSINQNIALNETNDDQTRSDTNEKTLVFSVKNSDIRKIKNSNNKKRKKDEYKNLKNNSKYVIEVQNISKYYISGKNKVSKILDGLDLKIAKGDFVVLFGKSGSGKSTLLNIISGLDRPTSGNVVVENINLPYLSNSQLTKFRREHIAFIFQQYHLLNNITGYENVETGAILCKHNDKESQIDLKKMFVEFELEDVMYKYPSQMSGGQQQRISIMRALAKNSNIIFADEPTGALDKNTGIIVLELLRKINSEQGKTIIMVSHDPDVIKYAKRTIYLNKGKIIKDERLNN